MCTVLGPGKRGVIWVQGCPFRCPECVAVETHDFVAGIEMSVAELAEYYANNREIEGMTFSGGEPMAQAESLSILVDQLRALRPDFSFLSYTGYGLEWLLKRGTPGQRKLISHLDILIDGLYEAERSLPILWRGSSNQSVHFLTDRYRHLSDLVDTFSGSQLEFEIDIEGNLSWMGIPPKGFREKFEQGMSMRGIPLQTKGHQDCA